MAEWATLKVNHGLRDGKGFFEKVFFPLMLGLVLMRGEIMGIYPFGIAFGAALIFKKEQGYLFGLLGVIAGALTLYGNFQESFMAVLQLILIFCALSLTLPHVRRKKQAGLILTGLTMGIVAVILLTTNFNSLVPNTVIAAGLSSILAGGFALVFWYAFLHREAVWRGEFTGEQGIAWLFILIGTLSGLQGLEVANVNFSIVLLSFFVLFVAKRYGAGTAAGVGALLGFLPQLSLNPGNLMNAGIYGLAGFCTGAFQRFGKWGTGLAFSGIILMLTFFLYQEAIYAQLVSSALGLILFLVWPGPSLKSNLPKEKAMPEVESAVTKVKALAEVIDQIALTYQAAEAQASDGKFEIPELMNILVERVCHNCPTIGVCWEREFYKTYKFLFDFFAIVEKEGPIKLEQLPVEWKRHCGKIKEMLLGVSFIVDQAKNQEAWRKRLSLNQEALTRQFQSVSRVIGNFAKELNARHNWENKKPNTLARRRRNFLDIGVASFSKNGSGISGDNYASLAFAPTQHAFILSDGMGVGEGAAKLSATALAFLEQLLTTGFEPEGALQALNSILVLRSPEESFVTIDMAVVDLESNNVKLIIAGASPSYFKNKNGVEEISVSGLPAGILNEIEIPVIDIEMQVDDSLVLVTDGIQDILKDGTDWLKDFLEETSASTSQELAALICKRARQLSGENLHDDGVVLVVRKTFWNE